ncbi:MAG: hypothetical protein IH867_12985 [Chloroflexi bacterium]|nr:hypothetical protein [Chloroflexota bacterium]
MKILIAGIDGYLGWTLASHLADRGHDVAGIDGTLIDAVNMARSFSGAKFPAVYVFNG